MTQSIKRTYKQKGLLVPFLSPLPLLGFIFVVSLNLYTILISRLFGRHGHIVGEGKGGGFPWVLLLLFFFSCMKEATCSAKTRN